MNAFRLLFLIVTLCGSLSVAAVTLVPSIVERQAATALEDRASLEARLLDEMERSAHDRRAALAGSVARSEPLMRSLSAPAGFGAPPLDAMFRQASSATWTENASEMDALALVDADGALVDERSRLGDIRIADLIQAAAFAAFEEPQTRFVGLNDRVFALTTTPVMVSRRPMGAILLAVEYDDEVAAQRRSGHGASAVYFVNRQIAASNLTSDVATEHVAATLRRVTPEAVGAPGMLRTRDPVSSDGLNYLIAPVRVGQMRDGGSVGAVIVVEAAAPPSSVVAVVADGIAKGTGTMKIWVVLVGGLFVFFAGLLLLDTALNRESRALGRRLRDSAMANDPVPLTVGAYPVWLRDIPEGFNAFLEAYRSHSPSARKQRHESSASILVDPSTQPITLPKAQASLSASDEMWKIASPAAPSSPVDDSQIGLIDLASGESAPTRPITEAVMTAPGAPSAAFGVADIEMEPVSAEEAEAELSGEVRATAGAASVEKTLMFGAEEARALIDYADGSSDDVVSGDEDVSTDFDVSESTDVDSAAADFLQAISGEYPATSVEEPDTYSSLERPIADMEEVHRVNPDNSGRQWGNAVTGSVAVVEDDAEPLTFDLDDDDSAESDHTLFSVGDGESDSLRTVSTASHRSVVDRTKQPSSDPVAVPVSSPDDSALPSPPGSPIQDGQSQLGHPPGPDFDEDERMPDPSGSFQALEETEERGFLASDDEISRLISAIHTGSHEIPRESANVTDVNELLAEADREIASRDLHSESDDDVDDVEPRLPSSATVPRVSLEKLADQARDSNDLMSAAEAKIRALRPQLTGGATVVASAGDRALFDDFVKAKKQCGQDTTRLTFSKFVMKLNKNRSALTRRYSCDEVRFDVVVRDNNVTLKATPIR